MTQPEIAVDFLTKMEADYAALYNKAEKLFYAIEDIEHKHKTSYRNRYCFDNFMLECGYITLEGSYQCYSESDTQTYDVRYAEFVNDEEYLKAYEDKLLEKQRLAAERNAQVAKEKKDKEYQEYLRLKSLYEKSE